MVATGAHSYCDLVNRHGQWAVKRRASLQAGLCAHLPVPQTCTVWDIATGVPVTQLIAHDREVYDVAWAPNSRDVFASVGADGSVRMFDLRSLEHSTILYEATAPPTSKTSNKGSSPRANGGSSTQLPSPLLRLAFSPTAPQYLSVCHADSPDVQILDTRSPGVPAFEVRGHTAPVNGMTWGGATMNGRGSDGRGGGSGETSGPGWLATCCELCGRHAGLDPVTWLTLDTTWCAFRKPMTPRCSCGISRRLSPRLHRPRHLRLRRLLLAPEPSPVLRRHRHNHSNRNRSPSLLSRTHTLRATS